MVYLSVWLGIYFTVTNLPDLIRGIDFTNVGSHLTTITLGYYLARSSIRELADGSAILKAVETQENKPT